jgi:hypothetical protein
MRLEPCAHCGGHGTLLSDYNWAEEACPDCRGVGLILGRWIDDITANDRLTPLYTDIEPCLPIVNRMKGA